MQRAPSIPRLRLFVSRLWAASAAPRHAPGISFERVLPTGAAHIVVRLEEVPLVLEKAGRVESVRGSLVAGVHSTAYRKDVSRPVACVGAMLEPGALPALFGASADAFADQHVRLADLVGAEADRLEDQLAARSDLPSRLDLFEAWLSTRLPAVRGLHPGVAEAIAGAGGRVGRAGDLADRAGLSPRRLSAIFRTAVGVSPKRWLRLRRFQRLVERAAATDLAWSELAWELGYSDQAHLARDFRAIAELTPTAYRDVAPIAPNHVPIHEGGAARPISSRREQTPGRESSDIATDHEDSTL